MDKSFEQILEEMLAAYQQNPQITEEELVKLVMPDAEDSVRQSAIDDAKEAGDYIQQFHDNAVSLAEAREEGRSRAYWMEREIINMTPDWNESEQSELIKAVNTSLEENINQTVAEED